jgi:hypothetical protein
MLGDLQSQSSVNGSPVWQQLKRVLVDPSNGCGWVKKFMTAGSNALAVETAPITSAVIPDGPPIAMMRQPASRIIDDSVEMDMLNTSYNQQQQPLDDDEGMKYDRRKRYRTRMATQWSLKFKEWRIALAKVKWGVWAAVAVMLLLVFIVMVGGFLRPGASADAITSSALAKDDVVLDGDSDLQFED